MPGEVSACAGTRGPLGSCRLPTWGQWWWWGQTCGTVFRTSKCYCSSGLLPEPSGHSARASLTWSPEALGWPGLGMQVQEYHRAAAFTMGVPVAAAMAQPPSSLLLAQVPRQVLEGRSLSFPQGQLLNGHMWSAFVPSCLTWSLASPNLTSRNHRPVSSSQGLLLGPLEPRAWRGQLARSHRRGAGERGSGRSCEAGEGCFP